MTKTNTQKIHQTKKVSKLENSELEIEGEIGSEHLKSYRDKAFEKIKKEAELPGFRKGHVPESMLIGKVGEISILEDGAYDAIRDTLPHLLSEHEYDFIGVPEVTITKIAHGEPLGFKIKIAVMPEVELADYKKIARNENSKETPKTEVGEKEVEEAIENILKTAANRSGDDKSPTVPELNDELVRKLGDFKDVSDFKIKLKEILIKEKENKAREKKRLEIVEKIISESKMSLPNVLIENELNKMEAQFKDDIEKMGMKVEDYLKHLKKSFEDMRKEWKPDAEKRAKLQIVLNRIAISEKIETDKNEVEKETAHILEHYKDANPARAKEYIEMVMTNQKVFEFLESVK
ncbi:MAG: tig, trigger factor, trigger factor [Parcubacteria group bacterium]|nr:tig, trigger factor, trigger factor [Parcubacteria group bacterium]